MNFFKIFAKTNNDRIYKNPMENWHVDFIEHISSIVRPKIYVELGLYECELFNKIIPYAEKLIGVDMNPESEKSMIKSSKTLFKNMSTDDFVKELHKNPILIDLLFIDANHSKKSVLADFNNYFPFIRNNGIILLHDGFPKNLKYTSQNLCGDGYKTIEKLSKKTANYEMMTIPVHPGLTICRKRTSQISW